MPENHERCNRCVYDCFYLRRFSSFPEENVRMYEDRLGLMEEEIFPRPWRDICVRYGYSREVAMGILEDLMSFLG